MHYWHCHRLVFAVAIVLAALFLAPNAQAHTGHLTPRQGMERTSETGPRPVELHALAGIASPAERLPQCGGLLCCGSACSSGAYIMSGDNVVLTPALIATVMFPPDGPARTGIPGEGVLRPPRA